MKPRPTPHIHLIGIGGIGVSALARLYRRTSCRVSGSDLARSEITDALRREGIRVFVGRHRSAHVASSVSRIIYTVATPSANPELRTARQRRIPTATYAEAVGELTRKFKTIAIAGSHGKSTTTALAALILMRGGLDPTLIVGTKLRELGNANARLGKSPYLVLEADEYRASFLNYAPAIAVVTNIDREHLDFYKNIKSITAAFLAFLSHIQPNGAAILNHDDLRLRRIASRLKRARPDVHIIWFSLRDRVASRVRKAIRIPGRHNVSNALAVYRMGRLLHIPEKKILSAIGAYRGAWRRFDYRGELEGARVFADYAHHPTEIKATLQAAREKFPGHRIWCVFQPHHYERTRDLFREFSGAFRACDGLVLLDIYEVAGRGTSKRSAQVNSERLASAISRRGTPALYLKQPVRLKAFLKTWLRPGDILFMMGAGSIWEMTEQLMRRA